MAFTPIHSILGGLAIGLAAFWNARLNGSVTGISGEVGRALRLSAPSFAFVAGLISSGVVFKLVIPTPFAADLLRLVPAQTVITAGALVGFGTKLGNGCTSGHGVCGLARSSFRSLVSTITFMSTAIITATSTSSLSYYKTILDRLAVSAAAAPTTIASPSPDEFPWMMAIIALGFVLPPSLGAVIQHVQRGSESGVLLRLAVQFVLGLCFGGGLIISRMAMPSKTVGFLDLRSGSWDWSLPFVFVGALPVAMAGFRPIMEGVKPTLTNFHSLPSNNTVDARLIIGAALFGIGWGLVGLCPGPAMVYLGAFPRTRNILAFCASLAVGNVLAQFVIDAL